MKNYKKIETAQGFTLIELLLVVALVAISVGVTSDVLISLVRSYNKTAVITEIEQQANFIGLKLEKELRTATNVVSSNSNNLTFQYNGATVCYTVASSNLFRSTSGCSTNLADALVATPAINQAVTGVNLACSGNCFTVSGTTPQVVEISMVFSQANAGSSTFRGQVNLRNTIVVRNTY